jgi:hypothetical protein
MLGPCPQRIKRLPKVLSDVPSRARDGRASAETDSLQEAYELQAPGALMSREARSTASASGVMAESDAIHVAGHLNVCEEDVDIIGCASKDTKSLSRVAGFEDGEAFFGEIAVT